MSSARISLDFEVLRAIDGAEEWFDDVVGSLSRVSDVDAVLVSDTALLDVIGDDLVVLDRAARASVIDDIRTALLAQRAAPSAAATKAGASTKGKHGVSMSRINSVFGKEISSRKRGPVELTAAHLECDHSFVIEPFGGLHCMICDFETTKASTRCKRGCDIILCGSCGFKMKHKVCAR